MWWNAIVWYNMLFKHIKHTSNLAECTGLQTKTLLICLVYIYSNPPSKSSSSKRNRSSSSSRSRSGRSNNNLCNNNVVAIAVGLGGVVDKLVAVSKKNHSVNWSSTEVEAVLVVVDKFIWCCVDLMIREVNSSHQLQRTDHERLLIWFTLLTLAEVMDELGQEVNLFFSSSMCMCSTCNGFWHQQARAHMYSVDTCTLTWQRQGYYSVIHLDSC